MCKCLFANRYAFNYIMNMNYENLEFRIVYLCISVRYRIEQTAGLCYKKDIILAVVVSVTAEKFSTRI